MTRAKVSRNLSDIVLRNEHLSQIQHRVSIKGENELSKQLLIYENITAISSDKHRELSIKRVEDYGFTGNVNSVPLMNVEFARAAMEYPIVFGGEGDDVTPVVILGVHNDDNLFVSDKDEWTGTYIPAFIRRYPFVFATNDDGKTFTLCVDETYKGCNTEGRGERLFDTDGNQTTYLKGVLGFLQEFQAQFQLTQAFCRKLVKLGLLESMRAQFSLPSGNTVALSGFMTVNRQRLVDLPADELKKMLTSGELELIYRHLHSLANLDKLGQLESASGAVAEESAATSEPDDTIRH